MTINVAGHRTSIRHSQSAREGWSNEGAGRPVGNQRSFRNNVCLLRRETRTGSRKSQVSRDTSCTALDRGLMYSPSVNGGAIALGHPLGATGVRQG